MERRCLNCFRTFNLISGYEAEVHKCPYCGFVELTEPKEPYHLKPGVVLQNRYIIGTVLGYGGFGITYKAWDNVLGNIIAIKEYYPTGLVQRIPGEKSVIVYEGSRKKEYLSGLERFLDEARNMAKFSNNKNIVHVENFFEENNTAYLVMEYLDGMSLKEYLKQENGKIDTNTAIEIISAIADALNEMHHENVIHRDVSPDNIFLCTEGRIKLIDFGAARFSNTEEEVTRSIILKPGYAPPEQYQSKSKQGPWTDIYALSATLYRCIVGSLPDESVNRIIEDEVLAPKEIDAEIPEYISNTIMKGMALNYELRFQNIDEFKKALGNQTKVLEPKKELKHRKNKRLITIAIASVLLLITGVIVWNIYRSKKAEVILEKATVEIWVAKEAEQNENDLQAMYEKATEVFMENQPNIELKWVFIEKSEYRDKLSEAYANHTMPTIYNADYASEEILKNSANLEKAFEYINIDDCYLMKEYKNEILESKKMPFSFKAPVVYISKRAGVANADTFELNSYGQLETIGTEKYYMAEGCENIYMASLKDSKLSEAIATAKNSSWNSYINDDVYPAFADGEVAYFLASTDEYTKVQSFKDENEQSLSGRYKVSKVNTSKIAVQFTNELSIDGSTTEREYAAASMLFSYLLEQGAQEIIYLGYSYTTENGDWIQVKNNGLPLCEEAFSSYIDTNPEMEILKDYLNKMEVCFE